MEPKGLEGMLASPLLQDYPIRRDRTVFLVTGECKENLVSELELTLLLSALKGFQSRRASG